jgi:DNA-binding GntR family transcriptional regulator
MNEGMVETLYTEIRAMTVDFRLKPGERVNEVALAKTLQASRTPLREALNRLVSEGFLTFERGRGFFCRTLSVSEVQNLYQVRQALESFAARVAAATAGETEIEALGRFLDETSDPSGCSLVALLAFDEHFHETVAGMTGNDELLRLLKNINARIRFFRWVDMEERRERTQGEHAAILAAIRAHDADRAASLVDHHIGRRRDEIAEALKECHSRLFVEDDFVTPQFTSFEDICA